MATYFTGNLGILGGEDDGGGGGGGGGGLGVHTMVLMNPTTYVHFNNTVDQHPPPDSSAAAASAGNFLLFNPSATAGNLHPPPQHLQHHAGGDHNNNVSAVLHGFMPRVYGTPVEAARESPRAEQGLSSEKRSSLGGVAVSGMQGLVLGSKYLKAAQELLDEVASVNNNNNSNITSTKNNNNSCSRSLLSKKSGGDDVDEKPAGGEETGGKAAAAAAVAEVTAAERQEIQMKKAKLVTMLHEVEERYKQYKKEMRMIVSWFETAAGSGSAKTYTCVALKTISKQFRCLKDAISSQIKPLNDSLGTGEEEEEEVNKTQGGGGGVGPTSTSSSSRRLRMVGHHVMRQQHCALQQLGMIQHHSNSNAWRPQRGLPERAVSVLRAWLFEHFLHPYPKDSDKIMLAKQTGLTRSQVSNWFINARVRLWKPMVEEMYLEEMKDQEKNNTSSKHNNNKKITNQNKPQDKDSMSKPVDGFSDKQDKTPVSEVQHNTYIMMKPDSFMNNNHSIPITASASATGFSILGASEFEGIAQGNPKKLRRIGLLHSPSVNMDANEVGEARNDDVSPRFRDEKEFAFVARNTNFMGGFEAYPVEETEQFTQSCYSGNNNNGVSLTLGLPHGESFSISASASSHHQNFFPNHQSIQAVEMAEPNEFGGIISNSESHPSATAYDTISLQQSQRRFAAQLLHDFVT